MALLRQPLGPRSALGRVNSGNRIGDDAMCLWSPSESGTTDAASSGVAGLAHLNAPGIGSTESGVSGLMASTTWRPKQFQKNASRGRASSAYTVIA